MSTENTETVISINHVSKVYKLFEKPMDRLKESLSLTHKNYHTDHFALEDISLEVHKGECVGIIGTNAECPDSVPGPSRKVAVRPSPACECL